MKKEEIAKICSEWDADYPNAPSSHFFFQGGLEIGIRLKENSEINVDEAFGIWMKENPKAPWNEIAFRTQGDSGIAQDWDAFFHGFASVNQNFV